MLINKNIARIVSWTLYSVTKRQSALTALRATHYEPKTAVNMSQYSSIDSNNFPVSTTSRITKYIPALSLGKHAQFTQPILRQCENGCKSVRNRAIALHCARFVISRWMTSIMSSTRNKHHEPYETIQSHEGLTIMTESHACVFTQKQHSIREIKRIYQ